MSLVKWWAISVCAADATTISRRMRIGTMSEWTAVGVIDFNEESEVDRE